MADEELRRVLFSLIDDCAIYEPDPIIAERDAVQRFAELWRKWKERDA